MREKKTDILILVGMPAVRKGHGCCNSDPSDDSELEQTDGFLSEVRRKGGRTAGEVGSGERLVE